MFDRMYATMDKATWGDGPWRTEPDKVQWTDAATDLPCLAVRNFQGNWCGYVGVSEGHPFYQVAYMDGPDGMLAVHGGITYSDHCQVGNEATSICHIPDPGQPDHVWWLGFDCGHADDFSPGLHARLGIKQPWWDGGIYRTLDYVRAECTSLAQQLFQMKEP